MNKNLVISFFLVFCFYSCSKAPDHKTIIVDGFTHIVSLMGDPIDLPYSYTSMGIADSLLILLKQGTDSLVTVFAPETRNVLASFGKIGKGPSEFISPPMFFGQYELRDNSIDLWLFDLNGRRYSLYNSIFGTNKTSVTQEFFINTKTMPEKFLFFENSNSIIGSSGSYFGQYFEFSPKNDSIFWTKKHLNKNKGRFNPHTFAGATDKHPTEQIFVTAYLYFKRIEIFDVTRDELISIVFQSDSRSEIGESNIDELRKKGLSYTDIQATSDFIYALYLNSKIESYGKGEFTSEIHVFDWDGNPLYKLVPNVPIEGFVVDEKNKKIYGRHYYTEGSITIFPLDGNPIIKD